MSQISEVKNFLKCVFTKKLLKKFAVILVIGAFCAGGGAFYLHQQKEIKKIAEAQAQTVIIENLAKEKNISLIDNNAVRSMVAKFIGTAENSITYKEISLRISDKKSKQVNLNSEIFQPVYKVSCIAENVKYKFYIDAVKGEILNIKAG